MGRIRNAICLWLFARIEVATDLKRYDCCFSPATTEFEARKVQKLLGGPNKVAYELEKPDVWFFQAGLDEKQKEAAKKRVAELFPTM